MGDYNKWLKTPSKFASQELPDRSAIVSSL